MDAASSGVRVSVIIPAFGAANPEALAIAVRSVRDQKHADVEILVVEEHISARRFDEIATTLGATYICYPVDERDGFSIGRARNAGLLRATGSIVLMQDADIALASSGFLVHLVQLCQQEPSCFFTAAPLRHFQKHEISAWRNALAGGARVADYLATCRLYDGVVYSALAPERVSLIKVPHPYNPEKQDREYVIDRSAYVAYRAATQGWSGNEPLLFTPCVWKGLVACSRDLLLQVGGYCEEYRRWGGEDGDIKWKLSHISRSWSLADDDDCLGVHMDHERPYFARDVYANNKALSAARRARGFASTVAADLAGNAPVAAALRMTRGAQ